MSRGLQDQIIFKTDKKECAMKLTSARSSGPPEQFRPRPFRGSSGGPIEPPVRRHTFFLDGSGLNSGTGEPVGRELSRPRSSISPTGAMTIRRAWSRTSEPTEVVGARLQALIRRILERGTGSRNDRGTQAQASSGRWARDARERARVEQAPTRVLMNTFRRPIRSR
jgi:hypothetical protein